MEKSNKQEFLEKYISDPDHELLAWEKWIQIRKDETSRLGKKTNRSPVDLTMNLIERVREDKERKVVLEHAQLEGKATARGTPWEQPVRLKQKCFNEPVYEAQRTAVELGHPSVIEHIGVPEYIQVTEKGLAGISKRKPCNKLNSEYIKYKALRENELKDKIEKIDPFRPDMSNLIIKGNKAQPSRKKLPPIPSIVVIPPPVAENAVQSVYAIRINNTVIFKNIPGQNLEHFQKLQKQTWHEKCTSWSYYFNVPLKRAGRSNLFLTNLGTVTLRYCWKKIKRPLPFIPEDNENQVFFFNKNEDVLSPGQSKHLCFTFLSNEAGIYSEFWEISFCNVSFFDNLTDKLAINLYGDSVENIKNMNREIELLKERIDKNAIKNIVISLLDEVVYKSSMVTAQSYPYEKMILEAEIFNTKNQLCYYHQTEVTKMKELYTEMVPSKTWDLSISNWRSMMMKKEFEERIKYYGLLKKSYTKLLKPWYEGEDIFTHKYRSTKLLLRKLADQVDAEYRNILEVMIHNMEFPEKSGAVVSSLRICPLSMDLLNKNLLHNYFYMRTYEHVTITMESIAGILSSIDLSTNAVVKRVFSLGNDWSSEKSQLSVKNYHAVLTVKFNMQNESCSDVATLLGELPHLAKKNHFEEKYVFKRK